ncbi:MAG: hypothetical protein JWQ42_3580 [Edaphobacter sp.]|nr:hypothetical protein [Edaphobacter sp.]
MQRHIGFLSVCLVFLLFPLSSLAQFATAGGLDCNGLSKIQRPLLRTNLCTDPRGFQGERFEDNGVYVGHDEPSIGFYSDVAQSGNNMQWEVVLPHERPLPATQTFENYIALWFSLALCDPNSFPRGPCIPNSDANSPSAGSAFLEMQFYPPGNPPFITQISCDLTHWCASLHINSLEVMDNGKLNPNCTETTNFAFIQRDGVPTGPPGPDTMNNASATPNNQTLLMNQGDHLRITIKDVPDDFDGGVLTMIDDLTTGQSGFMIASARNGYRTLDPNTCAGTDFSFHPEYATAKFGNFVPWAALQANVNVAFEIGHFTPGIKGDNDPDDAPCFPGPTVAGCLGADVDFDGTSYRHDWPDFTRKNANPVLIRSASGKGLGPLSAQGDDYVHPYRVMQIETEVGASESTCDVSNGEGCVVPPKGAQFYPFYAIKTDDAGEHEGCTLMFGDFNRRDIENFGGEAQYGAPNNTWFFGTNSGGVQPTPCTRHSHERDN